MNMEPNVINSMHENRRKLTVYCQEKNYNESNNMSSSPFSNKRSKSFHWSIEEGSETIPVVEAFTAAPQFSAVVTSRRRHSRNIKP
mmetsp:Transcript_23718/g.27310  ORF Transcript_23718/g.27310 Transcript_23718/m.27310 type:complete len:86 (-) Transcript_23718:147-404(-)